MLACMQALIAPALTLFRCYREGTIYMRLFEAENRLWTSPYIYVMAVLLVSIKVLYGLDGVPRPAPPGLPGAPNWKQWAESALDRLQGPVYPAPQEQVQTQFTLQCQVAFVAQPKASVSSWCKQHPCRDHSALPLLHCTAAELPQTAAKPCRSRMTSLLSHCIQHACILCC